MLHYTHVVGYLGQRFVSGNHFVGKTTVGTSVGGGRHGSRSQKDKSRGSGVEGDHDGNNIKFCVLKKKYDTIGVLSTMMQFVVYVDEVYDRSVETRKQGEMIFGMPMSR